LDSTVVDAVVHPFNVGPDNQAKGSAAQLKAIYAAHPLAFGERCSSPPVIVDVIDTHTEIGGEPSRSAAS
jgi:hypothetical protein